MNDNTQNLLVQLQPILVGMEDLAAMLGLSVSTLKQMDRNGRLGPMSIQVQTIKRRLWYVDEVRAWAQAGFPIREKWQKLKDLT